MFETPNEIVETEARDNNQQNNKISNDQSILETGKLRKEIKNETQTLKLNTKRQQMIQYQILQTL